MSKLISLKSIFPLIVLLIFAESCDLKPTAQTSQSGLSLLLLKPSDFNLTVEWEADSDWKLQEIEVVEGSNSFRRTFTLFKGQTDNGASINFTHDLLCYKEPYNLEASPRNDETEIKLKFLEFGDETSSFCYQLSNTDSIYCSSETQYSNLFSRITVWIDHDSSNKNLLEDLINNALTITNERVLNNPACE